MGLLGRTVFTLIIINCFLSVHSQTLTRYIFTASEQSSSGARCLDGSGAGFYYGAATSTDSANKWVIYLEGGGFCAIQTESGWKNIENCNARINSATGTSTVWPATRNRISLTGVLTYNQVYVPYCSGDLYSGTLKTPLSGKYAAGHLIIEAIINKLKAYDLLSARDVLFVGVSAGGVGTFVNANYVKSQLTSNTTLRVYSNCGWFPGGPLPPFNPTYIGDQFKIVYDQTNSYLDPACVAANTVRPWNCFSGNFSFPHISFPVFVANSIFDSNALSIQSGVTSNPSNGFSNPAANLYIVEFGQLMNESLKQVNTRPNAGLYATSLWTHGVSASALNTLLISWLSSSSPSKYMDSRTTPNGATLVLPTSSPSSPPTIKPTSKPTIKPTPSPSPSAFRTTVTVVGRPEDVVISTYNNGVAQLLSISSSRISTSIVRPNPVTSADETFRIVTIIQQGNPAVTSSQILNLQTTPTFINYLDSISLDLVSVTVVAN